MSVLRHITTSDEIDKLIKPEHHYRVIDYDPERPEKLLAPVLLTMRTIHAREIIKELQKQIEQYPQPDICTYLIINTGYDSK